MNKTRSKMLLLAVVAALVILQNIYLEGLHPAFLPSLIILIGLYGVWCAYRSISGLRAQTRLLQEEKEKEKKEQVDGLFSPPGDKDVKTYFEKLKGAWMNQHKSARPPLGDPWAERTHMQDRVEALIATQETADIRAVDIDLPQVGDLDELSVMAEHSRSCVVGMNVVISFLLILGILGTLMSIHGNMAGQEALQDLRGLRPALMPSCTAVFTTVVLLVCKGIYQHLSTNYIAELNRYTIIRLKPQLQRDASHGFLMDMVEDGQNDFNAAIKDLQGFADTAKSNGDKMAGQMYKLCETLKDIRTLAYETKLTAASMRGTRVNDQVNTTQQAMESVLDKMIDVGEQARGQAHILAANLEQLKRAATQSGGDFSERHKWLDEAWPKLGSQQAYALPDDRELSAKLRQLPALQKKDKALAAAVSGFSESWRALQGNLDKTLTQIQGAGNAMTALRNSAAGMQQQAARFLTAPVDVQKLGTMARETIQNRHRLDQYHAKLQEKSRGQQPPLVTVPEIIVVSGAILAAVVKFIIL